MSRNIKKCIVSSCKNTSKTCDKKFISVPSNPEIREAWFNAVEWKGSRPSRRTDLCCCEDHFKLEEDAENWMQWRFFGNETRLKLKHGVVPRFLLNLQKSCKERLASVNAKAGKIKRQKKKSTIVQTMGLARNANERKHKFFTEAGTKCAGITQYDGQWWIPGQESTRDNDVEQKSCFVPQCQNSTRSTPDKIFMYVKRERCTRKAWCEAVGREFDAFATFYCCEDHFNKMEDFENFMQHKLMGNKVKLKLKYGVLPHIFQCQQNGKKNRLCKSASSATIVKKPEAIGVCNVRENIREEVFPMTFPDFPNIVIKEEVMISESNPLTAAKCHSDSSNAQYFNATNNDRENVVESSHSLIDHDYICHKLPSQSHDIVKVGRHWVIKKKREKAIDEPLQFASVFIKEVLVPEVKNEDCPNEVDVFEDVQPAIYKNGDWDGRIYPNSSANSSLSFCGLKNEWEQDAKKTPKIREQETISRGLLNTPSEAVFKSFGKRISTEHCQKIQRNNNTHLCEICNKRFRTKYALKNHQLRHIRPFECSQCDQAFSRRSLLECHENLHNGIKTFQCHTCKSYLLTKHSLKKHLENHSKPFKCARCERAFSALTLLKTHEKKSCRRRDFQCDFCKKRFFWECSLKCHINIHVKPFECSQCKLKFSSAKVLQNHLKKHGRGNSQLNLSEKQMCILKDLKYRFNNGFWKELKCFLCDMAFTNRLDLRSHENKHTGRSNFECPICNEGFLGKHYLKRHMNTHSMH